MEGYGGFGKIYMFRDKYINNGFFFLRKGVYLCLGVLLVVWVCNIFKG